jgi:integrase/recombinase XerC/integrase/recombinase XerD
MTQAKQTPNQSRSANVQPARERTPIDHVLERLAPMDLPAKDHFEGYLRHKWRVNHKPKTIEGSFTSIMLFLRFYVTSGKSDIAQIKRSDLETFIEHEQDRGMHISTVKTRTASIVAFLHFLMEQDVIPLSILKKTIRFKLPDALPRAMNPKDVKRLIEVINDARDRALILLLLRTGMRIGEVLGLDVNDIDLKEKKVRLMEGEKNNMGRVVYLSNDALFALKRWLSVRNKEEHYLFYGQHGRLCYSAARSCFVKYLKKTRLDQKGYTVHCLRHTYASELLNAGMRLEVLQQLLGHEDIDITRRYARLTDKTREEEYFRAMAKIEKRGIDGNY